MACAVEAQPGHVVDQADQVNVAAVGMHVAPHGVERLTQARFQALRMQSMNQEKRAHELVAEQRLPNGRFFRVLDQL